MSQKKLRVGVLGATGMVGQRFLALLEHHPWYEVTLVAASGRSAGQAYEQAVAKRWAMTSAIPPKAAGLTVRDASDVSGIAAEVDFVFCAPAYSPFVKGVIKCILAPLFLGLDP